MKLTASCNPFVKRRGRVLTHTLMVMKLTSVLITVACLQVSAGVYARKISISLKNASLSGVFKEIQKQSAYHFLYSDEILESKKHVTINIKDGSIQEVLDNYLKQQLLDYTIDDKTIIIKRKGEAPVSPDEVSRKTAMDISGKITDEDGEPISGASVLIKGTKRGTSTDAGGNFHLQVPDGDIVLVISYVGFAATEVPVSKTGTLNISLKRKEEKIEDVVVVGFGTQKKVDITGAISSVSAEKLNQGINQSVSHALQGQASGVTVIQNSGEPGAGVEIRIRGAGSINDNSPLYVIDGIISSDISGLNPADIESMSVLKDAASASIYGSRGANGVVIVTTKKGKRNQKSTTTYNTSQGIQKAWKLPTALNAADRNLIHKEALTNDETPLTEPIWDYYNNPDNAITRTDWFKEVLKPAYISSHDLAIRGGSAKSNYSFSLGYLNNDGIVETTNFKRYNVRFNSQHEIANNLTFGENIFINVTRTKAADIRPSYNGVLSSALFNMRNIPVWEDEANKVYGSPLGDFPNPVASLDARDNISKSLNVGGNVYLEYKFLKLFTAKTDFSYNYGFSRNKNFTAIADGGGRGLTDNSLGETFNTGNTWIWNNTISFDKTLNRHHISGLVGMSAEAGINEGIYSGTAREFSNQDPPLRYLNNAGSFPEHATGGADDYSLQGYFGRVSYEFSDKYLLAANIRRDGSSRFAPDKRWGVFPSVSGGWRISKENFFSGLTDAVSELKIRASWGQLGNDKIPNYQYYSTVGGVGSPTLNGAAFPSVAQNRLANSTIKWEVTTQTDIGIDLSLMQNKLNITADYYDKKTTDILVRVPLVSSLGVGESPFRNAGNVSNKGYELGLNYRNRNHKLRYDVTANIGHVKNKLETLGVTGAKEIFTSDYKNTQVGRIAEGEALGHFYVIRSLGIFQSQAEVDSYKDKDGNIIQPSAQAGDVKFEDANGDGVISANDRVNAGNSFPTLTYSLNVSADYSGFDLNMLWIGSEGNKIFNGLKLGGVFMQGTGYNNSTDILDRWTPSSPGTSVPRVTIKDLNNNRTYSSLYIEDGSFVRMKYLTLGYTFNEKLIGRNISKLRLFVTLQNLVTITKYSGFDPEIGSDVGVSANMYGVDRGAYPQAKAYILGVNFNF